jgi:hypothetical protein
MSSSSLPGGFSAFKSISISQLWIGYTSTEGYYTLTDGSVVYLQYAGALQFCGGIKISDPSLNSLVDVVGKYTDLGTQISDVTSLDAKGNYVLTFIASISDDSLLCLVRLAGDITISDITFLLP